MDTEDQAELARQYDQLYAQYVKPLEKEHLGEYATVAPDGQLVIAPTAVEALEKAEHALPPGGFLIKIGDEPVDIWR